MRFLYSLSLLCAAVCIVADMPTGQAAEEIPWSTNIEASLQEARASGKPVLMEFTASWCGYCKRMEKTTFVDPNVVRVVSENFVAVQVDADQNKALVADLAIKGLPAILVVSPDLQIMERIAGFQTPEALLPKLQNVSARNTAMAVQQQLVAKRESQAASVPVVTQTARSRGELEFEAITHEEARPPKGTSIQTASKPRTLTTEKSVSAEPSESTADASTDETTQFFKQLQAEQKPVEAKQVANTKSAAAAKASFNGSCLVSAVEDRELVPGSPQSAHKYRGHTLYFRSDDHKQQFLAEPDRFWPMLDGSCAMTLLDEGEKVTGDLEFAAKFRSRIWLFSSEKKMKDFLLDPADVVEALAAEQSTDE